MSIGLYVTDRCHQTKCTMYKSPIVTEQALAVVTDPLSASPHTRIVNLAIIQKINDCVRKLTTFYLFVNKALGNTVHKETTDFMV